jgi:hypothetical protein
MICNIIILLNCLGGMWFCTAVAVGAMALRDLSLLTILWMGYIWTPTLNPMHFVWVISKALIGDI